MFDPEVDLNPNILEKKLKICQTEYNITRKVYCETVQDGGETFVLIAFPSNPNINHNQKKEVEDAYQDIQKNKEQITYVVHVHVIRNMEMLSLQFDLKKIRRTYDILPTMVYFNVLKAMGNAIAWRRQIRIPDELLSIPLYLVQCKNMIYTNEMKLKDLVVLMDRKQFKSCGVSQGCQANIGKAELVCCDIQTQQNYHEINYRGRSDFLEKFTDENRKKYKIPTPDRAQAKPAEEVLRKKWHIQI